MLKQVLLGKVRKIHPRVFSVFNSADALDKKGVSPWGVKLILAGSETNSPWLFLISADVLDK